MEIIGHRMNNNGFANDIVYREAVSQKDTKRVSVISKEWRHISSMIRMFAAVWIIMHSSVCKRILFISAALASFMDMKTKNRAFADLFWAWKSEQLGCCENSVLCLIESDAAVNLRILSASSYNGYGMGILL